MEKQNLKSYLESGEADLNMDNSDKLIAASILIDNALLDRWTIEDWNLWIRLANNISACMYRSDESRFTLYDYLDAVINHKSVKDWKTLVRESENKPAEFFTRMINIADEKRVTYSSN